MINEKIYSKRYKGLIDKWTLYIGKLTSEVIETIGNDINLDFIDTMHITSG